MHAYMVIAYNHETCKYLEQGRAFHKIPLKTFYNTVIGASETNLVSPNSIENPGTTNSKIGYTVILYKLINRVCYFIEYKAYFFLYLM